MIPEDNKLKVGLDPVFTGQKIKDDGPQASAFNVLNNQQYQPSVNNVANEKITIQNTERAKSIIRTYKSDMESAIQANHLSSINIALAENQKMTAKIRAIAEENPKTEEYSKSKIIIFIGTIFIVLSLIGFSFVFLTGNKQNQAPALITWPAMITTEYKDELNVETIGANKIINVLSSKLNGVQIPVNNIYNAYITTGTSTNRQLVGAKGFVVLIKSKMPEILKRSLLSDYMIGTFSFGKNFPFTIFKTNSFENAYAGLLQWENEMEKDFQIIFRLPGYEKSEGVLADLTPTVSKKFEDAVIINKDVRVLRNERREIIFLYGLINKETIIFTINDTAFKEILDRLDKEKTLKR